MNIRQAVVAFKQMVRWGDREARDKLVKHGYLIPITDPKMIHELAHERIDPIRKRWKCRYCWYERLFE